MKTILDQESAMTGYLDDLLSPIEPVNKIKSSSSISLIHSNTEINSKPAGDIKSEQDVVHVDENKPVSPVEEMPESVQSPNQPDWVSNTFSVYICTVNNIKLAIPCDSVELTEDYSSELKQLPNKPEWVMGLKLSADSFVAVVDTANLLLKQTRRSKTEQSYKKIIVLRSNRWGLAVDACSAETEISASSVHWRKDASTRLWLSGTEKEHNMAVVDTSKIFTEES